MAGIWDYTSMFKMPHKRNGLIIVTQSLGWEHYEVHEPEPHILLFKYVDSYPTRFLQGIDCVLQTTYQLCSARSIGRCCYSCENILEYAGSLMQRKTLQMEYAFTMLRLMPTMHYTSSPFERLF